MIKFHAGIALGSELDQGNCNNVPGVGSLTIDIFRVLVLGEPMGGPKPGFLSSGPPRS